MEHAEELAKMAVQETGFGKWEDKVLKNKLGSAITWESVKNMKTVGVLRENEETKVTEIGVPMGVVAALIPSTNPTSTVMYKSIISIKAGNAIVISPHPGAKNCITATYKIVKEAAERAGAPEGTVNCVSLTTVQATDALLKHPDVSIILATGGEAMVHAAYSSGNPALGVGPGNGPSYIEKSADIPMAVKRIMDSKTFDNGTICASEQSIVTETEIAEKVKEELKKQGGYFLTKEQSDKLSGFLLRANGTMNPKIVGRTALKIAEMAGITVPAGTKLLVSEQDPMNVSKKNPYSREKLCPVIAYMTYKTFKEGVAMMEANLDHEGKGHSIAVHSNTPENVEYAAIRCCVSRVVVNQPSGTTGGGSPTNGFTPTTTLGCGTWGNNSFAGNLNYEQFINITRVGYPFDESYLPDTDKAFED